MNGTSFTTKRRQVIRYNDFHPIASKLRQLQRASITTTISPDEGVVAQAVRTGGRRNAELIRR
jgi:hypothetical protein